jgi:hypothetical protein
MRQTIVRDLVGLVGLLGIGTSAYFKDWQLAPGIMGALLLTAAVVGTIRSQKRPAK